MSKTLCVSVVLLAAFGPVQLGGSLSLADEKSKDKPKEKVITTDSGLKYIELKEGTGKAAKAGDTVIVHYTGWLKDGTKFDSSKDRGDPFGFKLGAGRVIKGWDEGVAGMKVGGKRKLIIPPELAYGKRGAGNVIPPDAELTFEVELLKIKE
jgi:FKBP-type peptidyl-prolyl cis-trans isomerase